jgi:[ribosomal protein S18]-alanine N-acetyltransferase
MSDDIVLRGIKPHEFPFLEEMLYQAIFIPHGSEKHDKGIIFIPELYPYIQDFGKKTDIGLVAEIDCKLVGAIWTRLFKGYGFIDENTPELSMAIDTDFRGKGIGSKLLEAMFRRLKKKGYKQVSLSVDKRNFAYKLYQKRGFQDFEVKGNSVLMVKIF